MQKSEVLEQVLVTLLRRVFFKEMTKHKENHMYLKILQGFKGVINAAALFIRKKNGWMNGKGALQLQGWAF